jgi:hypothetical protein
MALAMIKSLYQMFATKDILEKNHIDEGELQWFLHPVSRHQKVGTNYPAGDHCDDA